MSRKATNLAKEHSYSFNRNIIPFPVSTTSKIKPPTSNSTNVINSSHLFKPKGELPLEEQARIYMDNHKKAERMLMVNFYTGGGPYRKGALDAIYRGFNPMNPK